MKNYERYLVTESTVDMKGKKCMGILKKNCYGTYKVGIDDLVHCSNCGHETKRYMSNKEIENMKKD